MNMASKSICRIQNPQGGHRDAAAGSALYNACMPTPSQIAALISLLDEPEPARAEAIIARMASWEEAERTALRNAAHGASDSVRRNIEAASVRARFLRLDAAWRACASNRRLPLEEALMLLAQSASADAKVNWASAELDEMAKRVGRRLSGDRAHDTGLEALRAVLCGEYGLCGNQADYYNPLNSYLPSVLDRRLGIPISLSCVVILVAQRLDLPVCGIGTPGRFLCYYGEPAIESGTYFDAFDGLRTLSRAQAELRLREMGLTPEPSMFAPANEREIVARTIRNLIAYHRTHDQHEAARRLLAWLDVLVTHGANA